MTVAYDLETTRPGVDLLAGPLEAHEAYRAFLGHEAFARRLRDIERAGSLRNRLYSAGFDAAECARLCRFSLHDPERAREYERAAAFYGVLYAKVVRWQARARGEAS
jgi:hypothetical protein